MTLAIRGAGSAIASELMTMPQVAMDCVAVPRDTLMPDADRYLFCQGVQIGKPAEAQEDEERGLQWRVNFAWIRDECDRLIATNDRARIVVIGSDAGFTGCYDEIYAETKARLHQYVRSKRLRTPRQQLVCIAPSVIEDGGMTLRRPDQDRLPAKRAAHPKGRFLWAVEVAKLVHYCLYVDAGYLSGIVIRLNGGAHTCSPS